MIFSSPLFLIGLLAVAIPIALHLFNLRRYRKVYFSNVNYLQQLQSETKRQSRLREYLILAARILAIVFLVLAFAQPFVPNKDMKMKKGGSAVSVYIDNSFSMENHNQEGTLLDMAKTKAREIATAFKPSDQFQLLTNDLEGRQFRWVGRDEFLQLVDEVEVSSAAPMLSAMAAKQQDFLHGNTTENRFAFVVSDFQQSTADLSQFPHDSLVSTTFVHLKAADVDNFSIDSVTFDSPVFMQGSHVTAWVSVTNHGEAPVENMSLKLFVGNKERAISSVTLPGHSSLRVEMSFRIETAGVLNCRIETADYPIIFDDKFFFSLNVSEQISMLEVVGGEAAHTSYVSKLFDHDSVVRYHQVSERNIDFNTLPYHNFIVINELSSITSGLAQTLQTFVSSGGSVLVVPSASADVESYNRALQILHAPMLSTFKKVTAKVGEVNTHSSLYRGVFAAASPNNLELPILQGYFPLKSTTSTVMESAMELANGDAYLTITRCGSGKVYLFATPLQPEYSDFVRQALFVPSVYNMALFSQPLGPTSTTIDNTSPVALVCRFTPDEGRCRLTNLDGSFELIPDVRQMAGRRYFFPHSQVKTAGNYLLHSDSRTQSVQTHATEGLSFNYSRRESDMLFYSRNEVSRLVKDNNLTSCRVVRNAEKPLDKYIRSRTEGVQLWRWCVILALLMLAAEIILIRRPIHKETKNKSA